MPGLNINPGGASGVIANLLVSAGQSASSGIQTGLERAQRQKMQDEQLFAEYGLFSPIGTLKNVLGDVDEATLSTWREQSLANIEKVPISVAWTLWGKAYPQLLDYDYRMRVLAQTSAMPKGGDTPPEKIDETSWQNASDAARQDFEKTTGYIPGSGKKGEKGFFGFGDGNQIAKNMGAAINDATVQREYGDPRINSGVDTLMANVDALNDLEQQKKGKTGTELAKIEMEQKKIKYRNGILRRDLNSLAKESFLQGASVTDRPNFFKAIHTSEATEDYIMAGNYYNPQNNQASGRVKTSAAAMAEQYVEANIDKIFKENPNANDAFNSVMRNIDQFGTGGFLFKTSADASAYLANVRKRIDDYYYSHNKQVVPDQFFTPPVGINSPTPTPTRIK